MRRMITDALFAKIRKLFQSIWTDDNGNVEVGKNLDVDGEISYNRGHKMPMYVHLLGIYDTDCNIYVYGKSASSEPIDTYQDLFTQLGDRLMLAVGKLRVDGLLVDACALDTYGRKISSAKFRFTNAEGKIGDILIQNIAPNASFEDAVYME